MGTIFKTSVVLLSFLFVFCNNKMNNYQVLDKTNFQTSIGGQKTDLFLFRERKFKGIHNKLRCQNCIPNCSRQI